MNAALSRCDTDTNVPDLTPVSSFTELDYLREAVAEERDILWGEIAELLCQHGTPGEFVAQLKDSIFSEKSSLSSLLLLAGYFGVVQHASKGLFRAAFAAELMYHIGTIHADITERNSIPRHRLPLHTGISGEFGLDGGNKGRDFALMAGDVLLGYAISALSLVEVESDRMRRALGLMTRAVTFSGVGGIRDLLRRDQSLSKVTPEEEVRTYELKTAHLLCAAPLSAGAVLGGANKGISDTLYLAGLQFGISLQLLRDYEGFMDTLCGAEPSERAISIDRLRSLPLLLLRRRCTPSERSFLERLFRTSVVSYDMITKIRRLTDAKRLDRIVRVYSKEQRDKALQLLSEPSLCTFQADPLLTQIIAVLFEYPSEMVALQ